MYHASIYAFYAGDYKDALEEFRSVWRGAMKTTQSRWIDSICYYTMMGECYYRLGQPEEALNCYTEALRLYLTYPDWMIRVQFTNIRPVAAAASPWGARAQGSQFGQYDVAMKIGLGEVNINDQINRAVQSKQPVAIQAPKLMVVEVQEIVRCTTLAIRRRTEILGPLSRYDRLTQDLITQLSRRPGLPNHWSQAWVDLPLGLALIAGGKDTEAIPVLTRSLVAAGQYDHPLTSVGLLELGKLALARGDFAAAKRFFYEASVAAYHYFDGGVLEEAFRYGAVTHLLANEQGIFAPLRVAYQWADRDRVQLRVSLLLSLAENALVRGQFRDATAAMEEAKSAMARRQMALADGGARLGYLRALLLFHEGKVPAGEQAVAAPLAFARQSSLWLYQIRQLGRLYSAGQITDSSRGTMTFRTAIELYGQLLTDPVAADWSLRPMDTLAVLMTPHVEAYEQWFRVALERKQHEAAIEIADLARRHRFLSSLPYGGRLLSLRWVLEAPDAMLGQQALLERQELRAQFPAYAELSQQAAQLRLSLERPAAAVDDEVKAAAAERSAWEQLAKIARQQEALLREMAVRRQKASLVFPPIRSAKQIQQSLPAGHVLWTFFSSGGNLYSFLLNSERYEYWRIQEPAALTRKIATMLRDMGHFDANRQLSNKDLSDQKWTRSALEVLDAICAGSQVDLAASMAEVVIVPDGPLWYVPFEALQVKVAGQPRTLMGRFRIRYAPTASLAVPDARAGSHLARTAVVVGQLYPQQPAANSGTLYAQTAQALGETYEVNRLPGSVSSSLYAKLMKRLIVYDDLTGTEQGGYSWSPLPLDRGKPGSTLADWMNLPWGGPEVIILPGYHTAAETGLARAPRGAPGSEVFLSVCGLMASGARTVLMSRWRTGGQSSADLVREFAQELPHLSAAEAWQRAVLVTATTPMDLKLEPRIKAELNGPTPRGSHPFVWSGYMLVDSGTSPKSADTEPAESTPADKAAPAEGATSTAAETPPPAASDTPAGAETPLPPAVTAPPATPPAAPAVEVPAAENPTADTPTGAAAGDKRPPGNEPQPDDKRAG